MRAYRLLWLSVVAAVCGLGVLAAAFGLAGAAFLSIAVVGAALGWSADSWMAQAGRAGRVSTTAMTAGGGCLTVVLAGWLWLLGPSGLGLALVVGACSPWVMDQFRVLRADRKGVEFLLTAERDLIDVAPSTSPGVDIDLRSLTDEQVFTLWRASFGRLERAPDAVARERIASMRAEILDELERRDQAGFARWMEKGPRAASDPGRFMSPGSGQT